MELCAVAKSGVHIYNFGQSDGEAPPALAGEPAHSFPAVPTADGCVWSADGGLLGLADSRTGGVTVYDASDGYAVLCKVKPLVGGPIRNFYFSPLGTFLVTHERYVKDG